ncbi:Grm1 [Symbiodinium sp. CCMP2592]|nr:Grm1 [Symbiodinium sp. CCMP2592]
MAVMRRVTAATCLSVWLSVSQLQCCRANELAIGVLMPLAWTQTQIATTVCFDLDVRKNFEPAIRARFGEPIVTIPNLHPGVANVTIRMGTTDMQPEVGVATAIDFMLGLDGELPISGLVGTVMSSISMPVAVVAAAQKVPQIAYGATSPSLSNKDNYPYFLRTISPDSIQALAFWNWLVTFEVPLAVCIYTTEPYGQGLFTAVQDLAKLDGQEDRIKGQGLRYMPQNYVFSEARATAELAKGLGSKFIFLMINSQVSNFLSVLRDLGMLGTGWQILSSTVSTQNLEEFPIGYMRWEDVSKGEKWPQFADIWTELTANDVVGPEARQRYKLDSLRVALEDMRSDVVTDSFFDDTSLLKTSESFLFDAGYTFILAINSLLNKGNNLTDIKGQLLLNEVCVADIQVGEWILRGRDEVCVDVII